MPDLDALIAKERWGLIGNGHRYHARWGDTAATWCDLRPMTRSAPFRPARYLCCGNCLAALRKEAGGA